ncbi:protein phosphatase 2C domain-containing protein [Aquimarina sp. RZ0]|uniref:protein phosphatase 2C domain-containing protein n=1 Tax=Aquimarina sp. RZ0 TaxID=2607730 RepID=UPI0011F37454|nr:protein phosphatase 2C domain-containing protein [Aquimarina sp. RZ0]KAA1243872.1 protein phosphatase 2C domain-containing protein [Aquimarina sp. RZ0]
MKIYSTLTIGSFHTNHCEDFLISEKISSDNLLVAVMDGCTMGQESVFASIIIGKILRNIAKEKFYKDFVEQQCIDKSISLKEVMQELFFQLKISKNQLGLETQELLSTLLIGIIDSKKRNAVFLAVGDGLIYYDGNVIEYEQNDKPDYLGYHLHKDFDIWYSSQKQKMIIKNFRDLSICTDGVFSFKNLKNKENQKKESDIIEYLLMNKEGIEYENFLEKKVRDLDTKENHVLTDDLAIIRVVNT